MDRLEALGHNGWRARSWAAVRLLVGAYLLVHFVGLLPWAAEVFSSAGMNTAPVSPLFRMMPSPLWLTDGPWMATAWVGVGAVASVAVGLGFNDRWAAGLALWVLATLQATNPLILNPALPHVGWVLLAHVVVPQPPPVWTLWRDPEAGASWRLPPSVFLAGWAVMTLGYTYSAWTKLAAPSWLDGQALRFVLENPLARDTAARTWLLGWPAALTAGTFAALALEGLAPLGLLRRVRPLMWGALLLLQLGLWLLVDFADLTWGMLVMTAWCFDPAWLGKGAPERVESSGSTPGGQPVVCSAP